MALSNGTATNSLASPIVELAANEPGAVLVLHGPDGVDPLAPFVEALTTHQLKVTTPRAPGFGGETVPVWLRSIDQLSYHYLDAVEPAASGPVNAVGVGIGAWLLLKMATKQPQLFASIVLVSPVGVKLNGREATQFVDLYALDIAERARVLYADPAAAMQRLNALDDVQLLALVHAQEAATRFTWEPYLHNPLLRHRLHRVQTRALVAYGTEDCFVRDTSYYGELAGMIGAKVARIDRAGHRVEEEQPDALAKVVADFLKETLP